LRGRALKRSPPARPGPGGLVPPAEVPSGLVKPVRRLRGMGEEAFRTGCRIRKIRLERLRAPRLEPELKRLLASRLE
jgi:hypothetical protein